MADEEWHPTIDPELEGALQLLRDLGVVVADMSAADIPRLRETYMAGLPSDDVLRHGGAVTVLERSIPGPAGAPELPMLVLRPESYHEPLPCLYTIANGGMIIRSTRFALTDLELQWIVQMGIAVVSVAPRVGPEDPHPAQIDDAYAGLAWLVKHADELDIDPGRIVLYGKSGGGGIAAATALMARDRGGPAIAHQILVYPMIDDRELTASSQFTGVVWDRSANRVGWSAILGDSLGGRGVSPYAAAARATSLADLPPTYLEVGSVEVFRDDILEFASRLARDAVPTELHLWAGGFHAYEMAVPDADVSRATIAARTSYLGRALRLASGRPPD